MLYAYIVRCYTTNDLLSFILSSSDHVTFHLRSRDRKLTVNSGDLLKLDCEFYMDDFNLFDNPILWRKIQLNESTQMNMNGNMMNPFSTSLFFPDPTPGSPNSTTNPGVKRFKVFFESHAPLHKLRLIISGEYQTYHLSQVNIRLISGEYQTQHSYFNDRIQLTNEIE